MWGYVALLIAGLWAQHCCRIPPGDDEDVVLVRCRKAAEGRNHVGSSTRIVIHPMAEYGQDAQGPYGRTGVSAAYGRMHLAPYGQQTSTVSRFRPQPVPECVSASSAAIRLEPQWVPAASRYLTVALFTPFLLGVPILAGVAVLCGCVLRRPGGTAHYRSGCDWGVWQGSGGS